MNERKQVIVFTDASMKYSNDIHKPLSAPVVAYGWIALSRCNDSNIVTLKDVYAKKDALVNGNSKGEQLAIIQSAKKFDSLDTDVYIFTDCSDIVAACDDYRSNGSTYHKYLSKQPDLVEIFDMSNVYINIVKGHSDVFFNEAINMFVLRVASSSATGICEKATQKTINELNVGIMKRTRVHGNLWIGDTKNCSIFRRIDVMRAFS